MGRVQAYDQESGVQLLKRAIARSGLSKKDFARDELVRDEHTIHDYLAGGRIPRVVRDKLEKLARRRPPSPA